MSADGWWSGDLDVRRPLREIELLMAADDLHLAEVPNRRNERSSAAGQQPKQRIVRFDNDRYFDTSAVLYAWPGTELLLCWRASAVITTETLAPLSFNLRTRSQAL
jgi:hypothetical protein